jgi:DNA anti-recombination protein RmuC
MRNNVEIFKRTKGARMSEDLVPLVWRKDDPLAPFYKEIRNLRRSVYHKVDSLQSELSAWKEDLKEKEKDIAMLLDDLKYTQGKLTIALEALKKIGSGPMSSRQTMSIAKEAIAKIEKGSAG